MHSRFLLIWLILTVPLAAASGMPARYTPDDDALVLLRVAASDDESWRALRQDRQRLQDNPENLTLALDVARRAIELGRLRDDPRLFGYAEGALSPWWHLPDPPPQVRVLRATILQYRHRFIAAIQDLDAVIEQHPGLPQAYLTRAVIHNVQARYQAALEDCAVLARQGIHLTALACSATPASLTGNAQRAFNLLGQIPEGAAGDDTRIWALTLRAEIAERLGRADTEKHFLKALETAGSRPDRYLANAYADWLLDQQRPREVLTLLAEFADSDGSLLRIAMARRQLLDIGDSSVANQLLRERAELRARFAAERERGEAVHEREAAMFELYLEDDPEAALWLARDNFRSQREPLDARILLASALAAGAPAQALPALQWMRQNAVEDVRLEPLVTAVESRLEQQEGR